MVDKQAELVFTIPLNLRGDEESKRKTALSPPSWFCDSILILVFL